MYKIEDIGDYQNRLTKEQAEEIVRHCNKFQKEPDICAWYDDMEDFYVDWIYDHRIFDNKADADERYSYGKEIGEFIEFDNGEIVRISI